MVENEVKEICSLDIEMYKCITNSIDTDKVVLTSKSILHILNHHPDAYNEVLLELKQAILDPDYIIADEKHEDTGIIVRKIESSMANGVHSFIVLRICTDSKNGVFANSVISGWKISDKRLQSYLRNKGVLYKKENS